MTSLIFQIRSFIVLHSGYDTQTGKPEGRKMSWPSYGLPGGKMLIMVLQENCSRLHGLPWAFISVSV